MFAGVFLTGGPVGHNKPLIFPLIAQRFGAQIIACKCVHTIDKIVGRHYCPGLGLPNCDFKSPEVDFPKSALRHILGNGLPLVFLIVTAEVLDGNTQTGMTLDASRDGCCHNAGHIRIFGIILKVSAAEGIAVDVQTGGKPEGHASLNHFCADGMTDFFNQGGIPGLCL